MTPLEILSVATLFCSLALPATFQSLPSCSTELGEPGICLLVGERTILDRLLHTQDVVADAFPLFVREEDVVFPPGGPASDWFTITMVDVSNRMLSGARGNVTLVAGGVGHQNVTLHFNSVRGRGYDFHVRIYGEDNYINDIQNN